MIGAIKFWLAQQIVGFAIWLAIVGTVFGVIGAFWLYLKIDEKWLQPRRFAKYRKRRSAR